MKVLVLDACQRAALACTRSLGASGHTVTTADEIAATLAGASKYSKDHLVYPSPYSNPKSFIDWMQKTLSDAAYDCILPVTEVTTDLLVRHRSRWPQVQLPFADIETIDRLSNKIELFKLAQDLGVPVPESTEVFKATELANAARQMGFPCVLKPARSRVLIENQWRATQVMIFDDENAMRQALENLPAHYFPALLQAFVPGKGAGLFALYQDGKLQASFAHNRLREKPPQGGVSVLSESKYPDPLIMEYSTKLLDAVGWQGVAMVEYRVTPDAKPYLMEINARFWGSLQLAIDAGVDFPALAIDPESKDRQLSNSYRQGVVLRWFLGDLDRLYLQFKRIRQTGIRQFGGECFQFLLTCVGSSRNEVLRISDPMPGLFELRRYLRR